MNVRYIYTVLSFLVTVMLVVVSYLFIDQPIAAYCNTLNQSIVDTFQWITMLGVSTGYLICFFILFFFFRFYKRQQDYAKRSLFLFLSIALSGIVSIIVKAIVGRFRPTMLFEENLYGVEFFRIGHEYNSFPSGHAVTVFALAMALSFLFPKYRFLFFCYALIVSISRVIINAHYIGDILAGAYIGVMTVFLLSWLFRHYALDKDCIAYGSNSQTTNE